jgi:hypothetical protein
MKNYIDKFLKEYKNSLNSWNNVLNAWENGNYLKPPKYASKMNGFLWQTLPINKDATSKFKQIFIKSNFSESMNSEPFEEYLKKAKSTDVAVSFLSKSKDTVLIVPTPDGDKNYTHLAEFIKSASITKQINFWKYVAKIIRKQLKELNDDDILYVYTHGHGVSYLHVRLEINKPKYFDPEKLDINKMEDYIFE